MIAISSTLKSVLEKTLPLTVGLFAIMSVQLIDAIGGYQKLTEKRDGITGYDATNTIMAGVVQKFQVTDAIIVVPMLYGGNTWMNAKVAGVKYNKDSLVGQAGVYAMYGFDAGHWLYANPKATYVKELKGWNN
ncbi:hypothetical protein [Vibrio rotiferianus]|uniref:hypothetical protein n=1 Tax=Vibrio rotiferianus TaxID=190895 RepID=UPI0038B23E6D